MKKVLVIFLIILTNGLNAIEIKKVFTNIKESITEDIFGKEIETLKTNDTVNTLNFSPDGKYLVSGNNDGTIVLWDVNSGEEIKTLNKHMRSVYAVSFSPNGKYLASGGWDNTIKIWDVDSGKEIKTLIKHNNSIRSISYSPDGKYLASGSDDSTIKIWNVDNGKEVKTLINNTPIYSVTFSPNGKYLASGNWDNTIKIWDVDSGKVVKTLKDHYGYVLSVSYSPDGKYLASGSTDNKINLWEISSGKKIDTFLGHTSSISSLSFSPNGKYLASASYSNDNTVRIWDVDSGVQLKELKSQSSSIYSVSFSPDGKYLASGSSDNTIKIWQVYYNSNKARAKRTVTVIDDETESSGILFKNLISDISKDSKKIYKPIKGNINANDFENLYSNNNNYSFYTINNTPIYIDAEKTKILVNIDKGKVIKNLYYSYELNLIYIEDEDVDIKGWVEPKNIGFITNDSLKVAILNNNIKSFTSIGGQIEESLNSGDIIEVIGKEKDFFYSENIGWINKKDAVIINESDKGKRIFTSLKEVKFNTDFNGTSYKNIKMGTEYSLLGATDKYYLVESNSTGEKGWIAIKDMSFHKPDLNDPVIILTNTTINENNMLKIEGEIYDDTTINSFLLNGSEIAIKPLKNFDKISYTPEVVYSFSSQWYLTKGIENNIEIKVIDGAGKSYSKVLQYTPELKTVNLNDFQIENIVTKLPKLEYSMELKDENNDGVLSGSEKMSLIVKVVNTGDGDAKNVNLKVNGINSNLLYNNTYSLGTVKPNETKIAVIEIKGKDDNISLTKSNFDLAIEEANGFSPFPAKFSFNTEPKLNPNLEIIDYAIDDENKNGQIEQGEKFDLYVLVQNTGEGESKNTILEVNKKTDGIIPMAETSLKFDSLKSGESKKIKFSFVTNFLYKGNGDLPFDINLYSERNIEKSSKAITLVMNKVMPTIKEVNLEAKKKNIVVASKISMISDIDDINKLITKAPDSKKWAVVVGVENYKKAPNVEFAERDALVTKEYFNKLLGVPNENIFYLSNSNATKTELETLLKVTLKNRISKDDEVYFYFSGHGVPANEGDSYLLLNDSDPANPKISAYPIKELYKDLGTLSTSKSYAFLDTCFSGGVARGDEKESLLGGTRAVMKVNDVALAYNNLTVYTATGKDQLSNSFKEQGHGLFTYFLLKGIGGSADIDGNKKISTEELQKYIKENVSKQSRILYGESRYQEPMLKSKNSGIVIN